MIKLTQVELIYLSFLMMVDDKMSLDLIQIIVDSWYLIASLLQINVVFTAILVF